MVRACQRCREAGPVPSGELYIPGSQSSLRLARGVTRSRRLILTTFPVFRSVAAVAGDEEVEKKIVIMTGIENGGNGAGARADTGKEMAAGSIRTETISGRERRQLDATGAMTMTRNLVGGVVSGPRPRYPPLPPPPSPPLAGRTKHRREDYTTSRSLRISRRALPR